MAAIVDCEPAKRLRRDWLGARAAFGPGHQLHFTLGWQSANFILLEARNEVEGGERRGKRDDWQGEWEGGRMGRSRRVNVGK